MTKKALPRLAILISGHGSNLQAFIDACGSGNLLANISLVISNKPDAAGLQRAARSDIPYACVNHKDYASREQFDAALVNALQAHDVDLVILAGFMRILTPVLIEPYLGRLMNIHPSLLPKYPGLHTRRPRALRGGTRTRPLPSGRRHSEYRTSRRAQCVNPVCAPAPSPPAACAAG